MMPGQTLLNINPDKLFEENTVGEIQNVQKKLQHEIERKREELRTMVGERYRDLIKAADTISDMKVNAENVIMHIEEMGTMCKDLQQKHLLGFKLDPGHSKVQRTSASSVYHSVAVQIKLLMIIPEQIWTAVEKEDYLQAAQLFLFARHVHTGLELHTSTEDSLKSTNVISWFPVIYRQWSAISHFRTAVLSGCRKKLKSIGLSPEEASSCLTSCLLLEGISSIQVLNLFLGIRSEALQDILHSEDHSSIKGQICKSLKLLAETIFLVHACFVEGCSHSVLPEGLMSKQLKSVVGRDAASALNLLNMKDTVSMKFLPPVIQEFRPSTSHPVNPVAPSEIRDTVSKWLAATQEFLCKQVVKLLDYVTSVKGLHVIREEAFTTLKEVEFQKHWDDLCQHLMIGKVNLWENYFSHLLTRRAKDLISNQLLASSNSFKAMMKQAVDHAKKEKSSQPEYDLRWFIWREWNGDLPQHGGWMSASSRTIQQSGGLLMKAKGYTLNVQKLCNSFDSKLEALVEDLLHYICDREQSKYSLILSGKEDPLKKPLSPFNKFMDKSEIQEHLQSCTVKCVAGLIEFIKSEHLKFVSDDQSDTKKDEACAIFIGRVFQAIVDLCPNLQKCVCSTVLTESHKVIISNPLSSDQAAWHELTRNLYNESDAAFLMWKSIATRRLKKHLEDKMEFSKPRDLLKAIPQWDTVNIQEEGEEGYSIRSTIRVPSQPSLPLQRALYSICQELNGLAPHTLPRKIHHGVVEDVVDKYLEQCEVTCKKDKIPQTLALQLLLDVRYITMLFISRESKILVTRAQDIAEALENKIDPFDLDVFHPYLQANVKKSVQRTQTLFGVLVPWEKLSVLAGLKGLTTTQQEDPTILPLSTNAPWFPLLPVSNPNAPKSSLNLETTSPRVSQPEKVKPKKTSHQKTKRDPSPGGIVRSGAAAFFGAMSTDWFGS